MDTIEINIAIDNSGVLSAVQAFEALEQKVGSIQATMLQAFSQIQSVITNAFISIQSSATSSFASIEEHLLNLNATSQESQTEISSVNALYDRQIGLVASLVGVGLQLAGTKTGLGKALQVLGSVYVGSEKVLGVAFKGMLSFGKLLGSIAVFLGGVAVKAVSAFGRGLVTLGGIVTTLGKFLRANPIFLIGSVLAGAAVLVIANWDSIVGLFQSLKKKLQPLFDTIGNAVSAVVDKVVGFIQSFVNANKEIFEAVSNIASSICKKDTLHME